MAVDKQPKNLQALILGSGQFSFADGATSAAAALISGYEDFNNVTAFSIVPKSQIKEHIGSYNGIRRVDRTGVTETRIGYQIKCDEASAQKMRHFLFGSLGAKWTQTVRTAAAADALTTPAAGRWYDLKIGGVRIRYLTTVAIVSTPSVVEDTDYVIDYIGGRIRFVTTPPGTLTSISLTAPAVTSTDPKSFQPVIPGNTSIRRGMARLICYDDDGTLAFDHEDFYCEIYPEGSPAFDGQKETEFTININIIGTLGQLLSVN